MDTSLACPAISSEWTFAASRGLAELESRLAAAADAWGVAVPAGLAARLAGQLATAADPTAMLDGLRLDELVLAQACAAGDPRALDAFDARVLARVPELLARHAPALDAAEVRQVLRERLLVAPPGDVPRIADYAGRGSLAGWLRVAILRTASNLRRGERPTTDLDHASALPGLAAASPELSLLAQRYGAGLQLALRDAFHALSPSERTVLRLHHLDGLTVDQLAPVLGTSRATAGRRLLAARDHLGSLCLDLLVDRTDTTPAELRSVLRALISRLDVSLRGVMLEPAG
jgi:RNA polymerase sigma-70 factor (ECF subfamily)